MVASLSAVVLHRIRYDLCESEGVPLGLVMAGYQLSSVSYLLTSEFWGGAVVKPITRRTSQWPPLSLLVGFAVALSVVAGPSSAVAMLPRLDWWDVPKRFFNAVDHKSSPYYLQATDFTLWPEHLTVDMIPPGCMDDTLSDTTGCPNQGFENVLAWVGRNQNQGFQPNVTIENYDTVRYLTSSSAGDVDSEWTVTSTVSIRDARDLGDYWDYIRAYELDIARINRPILIPSIVNGSGFQKPVVQAQCSAYYGLSSLREIEFPHSYLVSWPLSSYQDASWTMPVNFSASVRDSSSQHPIFNENIQGHHIQDEIYFQWIDMKNFTGAPALGALASFWTKNGSTALIACTIDAHWAPVSIFLDPRYDRVIFQDSPDPNRLLSQAKSNTSTSDMKRISIDKAWADTMDNPINGTNGNETLYTTKIRDLISGLGGDYGGNFQINGINLTAQGTIPYRVSTVLGMYLTEALASIQLNNSLVYHNYVNANYVLQMDNIDDGNFPYPGSPNLSFPDYANSQGFPEVQITIERYGYGWSFRDIPIKLATVVLVSQILVSLAHLIVIVSGRWTCESWTSMGQMLVLALTSLPPKSLGNTSAGVACLSTWKKGLKVRKLRDMRLQLVLDGDDKSEDGNVVGIKPRKMMKYA